MAMNYLGIFYELGQGARRNKQAALHWYRRAAALGNADARTNLKELE